jgi:4-alpha-glucanotransferase
MIRAALASVADRAVIPLQDILGLPTSSRMNLPGTAAGNWSWRFRSGALGGKIAKRLLELTELYGRCRGGN